MPEKTHTLLAPNPSFHLTKTDSRSPPTIFIFDHKTLQIISIFHKSLPHYTLKLHLRACLRSVSRGRRETPESYMQPVLLDCNQEG